MSELKDLKVYKCNDRFGVITLENYLEYEEIFKDVDIIDCYIMLQSGVTLNLYNVIQCKDTIILCENSKIKANELLECCDIDLKKNSTFVANKLTKVTSITLYDGCIFNSNILKEVHSLYLSYNSTYKNDVLEKCNFITLCNNTSLKVDSLKECNEIVVFHNVEMEKYLYEKFPNSIFNICDESTRYIT